MNPLYKVKEEYPRSSSSEPRGCGGDGPPEMVAPPQPIKGIYDVGPPPFLTKIFEMVDDPSTNNIITWSRAGASFVVRDPCSFSTNLLPRYFKHNNFTSFVRQLNTYGFRKIDPDIWEFANEGFLRGQKHLLRNIKRRKPPSQPLSPNEAASIGPCVEVGRFGQDEEIDRLKRDNQVLIVELVKLRQQQQSTRAYIQAMEQRLQGTEMKQRQMMNFLARAIQNPAFIQQLVQLKEKREEMAEAITKKRRWPIDRGGSNLVKVEPLEVGEFGFQVSELEALAMEMQGLSKVRKEEEKGKEKVEILENGDRELDEGFWEELLLEGELDRPSCGVEDEEEDVDVLTDRLGFLGSSPKK